MRKALRLGGVTERFGTVTALDALGFAVGPAS